MNWIQVRHRLPERDVTILVWNNKSKNTEMAFLDKDKKFVFLDGDQVVNEYSDDCITHWMKLPEDPKEY